jgi:hypothetical protein
MPQPSTCSPREFPSADHDAVRRQASYNPNVVQHFEALRCRKPRTGDVNRLHTENNGFCFYILREQLKSSHGILHWPHSCCIGDVLSSLLLYFFAGARRRSGRVPRLRTSPKPASARLRCKRISAGAFETGPNPPGFFFAPSRDGSCPVPHAQSPAVPNKNPLASSPSATSPSGSRPRLYSSMRFFHLRKSVMLSGSMRISTRRKLASRRFISF